MEIIRQVGSSARMKPLFDSYRVQSGRDVFVRRPQVHTADNPSRRKLGD